MQPRPRRQNVAHGDSHGKAQHLKVHLRAPGVEIPSTAPGNAYQSPFAEPGEIAGSCSGIQGRARERPSLHAKKTAALAVCTQPLHTPSFTLSLLDPQFDDGIHCVALVEGYGDFEPVRSLLPLDVAAMQATRRLHGLLQRW